MRRRTIILFTNSVSIPTAIYSTFLHIHPIKRNTVQKVERKGGKNLGGVCLGESFHDSDDTLYDVALLQGMGVCREGYCPDT